SNFNAEFFGEPLADFLRQAVMDASRTLFGGVKNRDWRRGAHAHAKPDQGRKAKSHQRSNLKPEGMPRAQVPDYAKRQQEDSRGNGGQRDHPTMDNAMNLLAAAAVFTAGEVAFIVATHLRRQAGNIIPPARQNLANDWI